MSANQFLDHFDRICDAPDAVPHLRRFILELAVRGKLADRDPRDEPASELLKRIQAEKERCIREGQMKNQESLSDVRPDEAWFEIPASWDWVRLGVIAQVLMGQSPKGDTYNKSGEGIPLINGPVEFTEGPFGKTVINQYTTAPTNICEEGDLLLCVRGSTTGRTNIAGFRACIGRGVAAIRPFFVNQYVRLFIWRLRAAIIAMGRGIAFPSVSRRQIEDLPVPLPPLAEQHRIVGKVDELMALCDRLEAAQAERESRQDKLAAASLNRVNNGTIGEEFREHARFHLRHLPRLTTRPEHIQQLRQTILNLAVRGKLVSQNPRDEPIGKLLNRISIEQSVLLKEGLLKNRVISSDLQNADHPHNIPSDWRWMRLAELISFGPQNGVSPKETKNDKAPKALTLTATTSGFFNSTHYKYVDLRESDCHSYWLSTGDVLFQRGNTREYVGIAAVFDGPERTFVFPDLMIRVRFSNSLDLRYIHTTLISPPLRNYFSSQATGASSTMPKISQGILLNIPIPVPPLAEQQRIVAKVDELMALCNRLEAQLNTTQTESRHLLEAVLHDALNGNRELEQGSFS